MDEKEIFKNNLCNLKMCEFFNACKTRKRFACLFWEGFIDETVRLSDILVLYPNMDIYGIALKIAKERIANRIKHHEDDASICFSCDKVRC